MTERKELEQKMRDEGRLPPGQSLTLKFPVLHEATVTIPEIDLNTWRLRLWGALENEVILTFSEIDRLPKHDLTLDVHCVDKWTQCETHWRGVRLRTLIDEGIIKPLPEAKFVLQHAVRYQTNVPLEAMLSENFLLATHYEGTPLPAERGAPLRVVTGSIPGRRDLTDVYLWKGAKWLTGLEFLTEDRKGVWESGRYHNVGDVWKEQRFNS
ncbi:MAG: molybdopterin-dependent oxidoreductase [Anaerolineaceae bacterium]|nr:molybdopterin-dependent oxidoreductase [Anaerolineaceae bacterium]